MKKGLALLLILFWVIPSVAQQNNVYPLQPANFPYGSILNNPSWSHIDYLTDFRLISGFYTNLGEQVGFYLADAGVHINNQHNTGLTIFTEQETSYLKRTKVLFRYAYHLRISEEFTAVAGIGAGIFNYYVKPTASSAGASSFAPDANVGFTLYSENFRTGIAVSQLFNSRIRPVNKEFELGRYLTFLLEKSFAATDVIQLKASTMIWYGDTNFRGYQLLTQCIFNNILLAGIGFDSRKSVNFTLGVVEIPVIKFNSDLIFAFKHGFAEVNAFNQTRLELLLHIYPINKN